MEDVLVEWKKNVQGVKWKFLMNNFSEFQNHSLDRNIKTLRDFFHPLDLDKKQIERKNQISDVDPSQYWLLFILSQSSLGTIYLVFELCNVIDYFKVRNLHYIKYKLLKKNGRIDKNSFRDKYFEVFFNYNLEKSGIKVDLEKCYRNQINKNNEGHDSYFKFKNETYIVECLKLKSWKEYYNSSAYKMIQVLIKALKKPPSKTHILPLTIFGKMSGDFKNVDNDFNLILKEYLSLINTCNLTDFQTSSRVFEDLKIFSGRKIQNTELEKSVITKDYIRISAEFKGIEFLTSLKKDIGIDISRAKEERHHFEIKSNYRVRKSQQKFENHLTEKITKKIRQLNGIKSEKIIIAIEFEAYLGFGSFPIEINYPFNKVLQKSNSNLTVILFFKNSKGTRVELNKKSFYNKNDPFMNFLLNGKLL